MHIVNVKPHFLHIVKGNYSHACEDLMNEIQALSLPESSLTRFVSKYVFTFSYMKKKYSQSEVYKTTSQRC